MTKFYYLHAYINFSFSAKSSTILCTKFRILNEKTENAVRVNKHCRKSKRKKIKFQTCANHQIPVKLSMDIERSRAFKSSSYSYLKIKHSLPLCNHTAKCKKHKDKL